MLRAIASPSGSEEWMIPSGQREGWSDQVEDVDIEKMMRIR